MGAKHSQNNNESNSSPASGSRSIQIESHRTAHNQEGTQLPNKGTLTDSYHPKDSYEEPDSGSNSSRKKMGTLLVVNNPTSTASEPLESSQKHPVLQRLDEIPHFSPILQKRTIKPLSYGWINEKSLVSNNLVHHALEFSPYLNISYLFQTLVHDNAHAISVRQTKLTKCIKQTDKTLAQAMKYYVERQKSYAKYAEKLSKVSECTKILVKCQSTIQSCKNTIQTLNQLLPIDERLEPFVWGEENIELVEFN